MNPDDMESDESHFDEIFERIRADYLVCQGKTAEEAAELAEAHYEQFEFMGKKVGQYPTYDFGCYLWGLVDLAFGKEKLYEAIADPGAFVGLSNRATEEKYRL